MLDTKEQIADRMAIEQTHSWLYRCFPPRPTKCIVCGAHKSDTDLKRCLS